MLNFKKIYDNALVQINEEVESEDKDTKNSDKENSKPVTADSLVKDLMKLQPAQLLKYIAKQEDSDAKAWLLKNLIPFTIHVVKNGYIKTKDLAKSVKDINKKNVSDDTGIDYDNLDIDESTVKSIYAFDEDALQKLQKFIDQYKKEMESAKSDIERSCKEVQSDVKKSGVKVDNKKLANNTLDVVSVIDDSENKGKSGKELTKLVDQRIEQSDVINQIEKHAEEIKRLTAKLKNKVDPKYAKMSSEELAKISNGKGKKHTNESKIISEASDSKKALGAKAFAAILKYKKEHDLPGTMKSLDPDDSMAIKKLPEVAAWLKSSGGTTKTFRTNNLHKLVTKSDQILSGADDQSKQYRAILGLKMDKSFKDPDDFISKTLNSSAGAEDVATDAATNSNGFKFDFGEAKKKIEEFGEMADDGLSNSEMTEIAKFQNELWDALDWANENAKSNDPIIAATVAQIQKAAREFEHFRLEYHDEFDVETYNKTFIDIMNNRIPEASGNAKNIAKLAADNEETKEVAKSWLGKLGHAFAQFAGAKAIAKIGKFTLKYGKTGVDAIGGQYLKFKEDQNVVAEMKFIVMNDENSDSKHSDTQFSVRFDASDLKWHATNLDNRKQKIDKEDILIQKALGSKSGKEFKKACIDRWTTIFEPKDESMKFVSYFIKNYEKLGVKISDKKIKKYFETLKQLIDNFDEVKKQFA